MAKPLPERGLRVGQRAELTWVATPAHGVTLGQSGRTTVFSTPSMIHLMEHAARKLLAPFLGPREESVGVDVNIAHLAATPLGGPVRATAELIGLSQRQAEFAVSAYDRHRQIGQGGHTRAVVDVERLAAKLEPSSTQIDPPEHDAAILQQVSSHRIGHVAPWSDLVPDTGSLPKLTHLRFSQEGTVGVIANDRAQALNAMHPETLDDFERLLPWLAGHADALRVVILTGAGKNFCAGSDIRAVQAMSIGEASTFSQRQGILSNRLAEIPQPVIAAVNGYAFGGGCTLAASCDVRLASTSASFSMPEIKLGWPGGWGMSALYRALGHARTLELCLTGKTITARTAAEWGFVQQVVPSGRLMTEARKLAQQLAAQPPLALRENKWLMHTLAGREARESYREEDAAYIRCLRTRDAQEGIEAFLQKRPGNFTGT